MDVEAGGEGVMEREETRTNDLKISREMAHILDNLDYVSQDDGSYLVKLSDQQLKALDKPTIEQVKSNLAIIGGYWTKQGYIFPSSLSWGDRMGRACEEGLVDDTYRYWQQFQTPKDLAERMVKMLELPPGKLVLEPSCGRGRLIDALLDAKYPAFAIEIEETAADIVRYKYKKRLVERSLFFWQGGFLDFWQKHGPGGSEKHLQFFGCVMHPPHMDGADLDHVSAAYDLLLPGAPLVAIVSRSSLTDPENIDFCKWLAEVGAADETLPKDMFGSWLDGVLLFLQKPST